MANPKRCSEMKEILFSNLRLLGFDTIKMETKYNVSFNSNMFDVPNRIGAEVVLYFLFQYMNPTLCSEQFRDCWPTYDKKAEFQFRKSCNEWLCVLKKEEASAFLPRLNASILLSPGGPKFIHLMMSFSSFVLFKKLKSFKGSNIHLVEHPSAESVALLDVKNKAIEHYISLEMALFFEKLNLNVENSKNRLYIQEKVKNYRFLCKKLKALDQMKLKEVNTLVKTAVSNSSEIPTKRTVSMFDSGQDSYSAKRERQNEQLEKNWKEFIAFEKVLSDDRKTIQSVLDKNSSQPVLDGADISVRIPELLLRKCHKEMHQREIDNVYVGGKFNVVSFLQLCNLCLELYLQQLNSDSLPDLSAEEKTLTMEAHKRRSYFNDLTNLIEEISTCKLDVEDAILELRKQLSRSLLANENINIEGKSPGLRLLAPLSPRSFTSISSESPYTTPTGLVSQNLKKKDTPNVKENLLKSLHGKSFRKADTPNKSFKSSPLNSSCIETKQGSVVNTETKRKNIQAQEKVSRNSSISDVHNSPLRMAEKLNDCHSDVPKENSSNHFDILADEIVESFFNETSGYNETLHSSPESLDVSGKSAGKYSMQDKVHRIKSIEPDLKLNTFNSISSQCKADTSYGHPKYSLSPFTIGLNANRTGNMSASRNGNTSKTHNCNPTSATRIRNSHEKNSSQPMNLEHVSMIDTLFSLDEDRSKIKIKSPETSLYASNSDTDSESRLTGSDTNHEISLIAFENRPPGDGADAINPLLPPGRVVFGTDSLYVQKNKSPDILNDSFGSQLKKQSKHGLIDDKTVKSSKLDFFIDPDDMDEDLESIVPPILVDLDENFFSPAEQGILVNRPETSHKDVRFSHNLSSPASTLVVSSTSGESINSCSYASTILFTQSPKFVNKTVNSTPPSLTMPSYSELQARLAKLKAESEMCLILDD